MTMMTFKEQLKGDLDRLSPAPELLDRVSEMMREEAAKPRSAFYASAIRFAGMAAAVCLLSFGAVRLGLFAPIEPDTGGVDTSGKDLAAEEGTNDTNVGNDGIALYNDAVGIDNTDGFSAETEVPAETAAAPAPLLKGRSGAESAVGGDELALYYGLCDPSIASIDGGIIDVIGAEAFEEWRQGKESVGCTTDLAEEVNLYALILDFPQHKAAMEARLTELAEIDRANGWKVSPDEEEIELLMNGEKDAISEYFVSPAAIWHDGKIYSPEWLDTHEVSDYEAEAIPPEKIREKLDEILWLSAFTDLSGLAEKLSIYLGEPIELPVPAEKPEERWEFPAVEDGFEEIGEEAEIAEDIENNENFGE